MKIPILFLAAFSTVATVIATPIAFNESLAQRHRPHAPHHTPVVINEMSSFECVRQCWRTIYPEIEEWRQEEFCGNLGLEIDILMSRKIDPCVELTCDAVQLISLRREGFVWFCKFCGWLPKLIKMYRVEC